MSLTDRDRKILLALIPLAAIIAYWFLLLAPKHQEASKIKDQLTQAEQVRDAAQQKASQLSGDGAAAERTFQAMAGRDDTRLLGLHGLFIEAQRRGDVAAARLYAEEAARKTPVPHPTDKSPYRRLRSAPDGSGCGLNRTHNHCSAHACRQNLSFPK